MYYIGVDLGSTNIKVALYNQDMSLIDRQSYPVDYIRENGFVESDRYHDHNQQDPYGSGFSNHPYRSGRIFGRGGQKRQYTYERHLLDG